MKETGSGYLRELIRILVRNLGILEKDESTCCGTTVAQCHAIVEIGRAKDISLNQLADTLGLDKSTMSRTINNLVESELAVRDLYQEDRRYVSIMLTGKGKKVYESIEGSMENYYNDIFLSIPEHKREQVIESLGLLIEAVKQNKCC